MTDNRSERLRQRRKQSTEAVDDGTRENGDSSGSDSESEPGDDAPSEDEPASTSVKEEQIGTYMYLPKSQTKDLRRLYNVLKAEYEFEYDEEFEKNRHFYPLVVQYGLESLKDAEASEIRQWLTEIG